MGSPIQEAGFFLVKAIFDLALILFLLRFLLESLRVDAFNPFSQFLLKVTTPVIRPLRQVIPAYRQYNLACFIAAWLISIIKFTLIFFLGAGLLPDISGLAVLGIADLLAMLVNIFFFAILVQVIMSWISPNTYNPVLSVLYRVTEPLLAPARRLIPPIGGLDISPILVILFLQLLNILVTSPLMRFGEQLAF